MAEDKKLEQLLLAVKKLYEEFCAIEKEISNHADINWIIGDIDILDGTEVYRSNFPARSLYDRFCDMENGMREKEKSLDSLISELRNNILDVINDQKDRLVKAYFPIAPTYKCKRQFAERGTHAWCIEEGEVIDVCGVDFSEHGDKELYVRAKKVGGGYEYAISYKDLLESFESIG